MIGDQLLGAALLTVSKPWPWFVAGPLIGLFVPLLLLVGNKMFGISASLRHICAAALPGKAEFFKYDWRGVGGWNLTFAVGIFAGGALAAHFLGASGIVGISPAARATLASLGVHDFGGTMPREFFRWGALATWQGLTMIVGGGFLVGFGASYAGGCTSGHAIAGLADFQLPSLVAVVGFFAGGLISTWLIIPHLLVT